MKIAMFLDTVYPPDARVENEAISLLENGHDVYLFSLDNQNNKKYEVVNGIKVYRYRKTKLIYKLSALAFTFPFYHKLIKGYIKHFISIIKPDVLHIHDMVIAPAVFRENKSDIPVVLDLHENRPEIMKYYPHINTMSGKILINVRKWQKKQNELIKKAAKLILVTKEAKNEVVKQKLIPDEDIVVVPNTVHPDIFLEYPIDKSIKERFKDRFNILYVGDTGLRRGILDAIEAIDFLKDKIKNINLILVGNSSKDDILYEKVKKLNCENHVHFEGWQDLTLFPSYINAADICISPLHRNLHHDTTYANKIFQYMALGKSIIVSDCEAQAKVILKENCGLVHEANNPIDLADKMMLLFNDPELRAKMGVNAKKAFINRWNWKITSRDLIKLYSDLNSSKTKSTR